MELTCYSSAQTIFVPRLASLASWTTIRFAMRTPEPLKHAEGMESIWESEDSVHTPSWLVSSSSLVVATSRPALICRSCLARPQQEQSKCVTSESSPDQFSVISRLGDVSQPVVQLKLRLLPRRAVQLTDRALYTVTGSTDCARDVDDHVDDPTRLHVRNHRQLTFFRC